MVSGDLPSESTLPNAEVIRQTARDVLARSDYDLEPLREGTPYWREVLGDVFHMLIQPFVKLFGWLSDISPVLAWLVIVLLIVILCALIVHIIYTITVVLGRQQRSGKVSLADDRRRNDPSALEQQSSELAAAGDWVMAIRLLFKAGLVRLADGEDRTLRPGVTNREHMRHYQDVSVRAPLQTFVDTIDTKWYGRGVCHQDDYQRCAEAHKQICYWIRTSQS